MINKIRNDKNSCIKLKKQLMNITNNINSVIKRNNKSLDIRIKENKYMSEELLLRHYHYITQQFKSQEKFYLWYV